MKKGIYVYTGKELLPYSEYIERWLNGEKFEDC